jgi:hypothetical protein
MKNSCITESASIFAFGRDATFFARASKSSWTCFPRLDRKSNLIKLPPRPALQVLGVGPVNPINSWRWRVSKNNLNINGQGFIKDLDLAILLVLAAAFVGADKEVDEFVDDISWRIIAGVRIRTAPKIGVIHIIIINIDDLFAVVRYG